MPARIVSSLCHPNGTAKAENKKKTFTIGSDVLTTANTTGSDFLQSWKSYTATRPADEDLKALFTIGRFHQWEGKGGSRLTAEHVEARAAFVKAVLDRDQSVDKRPRPTNNDNVRVCM